MSQVPQNVVLRPLRADEDAEGIHAVIVGCAEADQIDPFSTCESITPLPEVAQILSSYDPSLFCVAEVNGQIVGCNYLTWWEEDNEVWLYLHQGLVLPAFRNQGIGTALLNWSEARIRQIAAQQPKGTPIYGANASSTAVDSTKMLLDHGYEVVFTLAQMHFDDFASLPPVSVPEGMILRPPTPDDAPAMRASSRAAWSKGSFGLPIAEEEEKEVAQLRDDIVKQGALWRVIMAGDAVAGQIWCSLHEANGVHYGVVDEINVHPDYRRQGVAQALMIDALRRFEAAGATLARLHTDDGNRNGAKSLYEKLGFRRVKTFPRYRKAMEE